LIKITISNKLKTSRMLEEMKKSLQRDAYDFQTGDLIEARFGAGDEFYPGKIVRACGNDTFDIDYDDGDKEKRVKKELICLAANQLFLNRVNNKKAPPL
jgi:hypothetical protein